MNGLYEYRSYFMSTLYGPLANLVKQDSTTQGTWNGTYGTQGYDVIGSSSSLPSYATVTPSGESTYTWAASTTDPRALQTAGGGRIAAGWYSTSSFTVNVNITDGLQHDLELYFVDWDSDARAETVQISDLATGLVLSTQSISSFHNGVYLNFAVGGDIVITITGTAGTNAVLNGLFFDPLHMPTPAPPTSATFLNTDPTTQGTWMGVYGVQGYDIIGSSANLPGYASVTPSGQLSYTWAASTTDPRALQAPAGGGIAACWYSASSFTVDVNLADGAEHYVELYFVDWDNRNRAETVQISNALTGAVLSTRSISSFQGGVYLDYAVSGDIVITITSKAGPNAVLSGVFLDPPPAPMATFLMRDDSTSGAWIGTYGAQGYDLIGATLSLPSYATVGPSGQSNFTWAASTTDPRALQIPGGGGVAASWFSKSSFTVDVNLLDGTEHELELYFVDWDNKNRAETVQISDAATGAVLSTQSISSFQGGAYLDYAVSGNIVITITSTAGPNAVLSGLFLDPAPGATAMFLKQDTTTQGTWNGTYGTQGHDIINSSASLPSYATVTPSDQSSYTWAASTTDPRALQVPGGGGIAASWFSASSFTVDVNLTDGAQHDLELYFVDWDKKGRAETVQISDATTGDVLSTQSISSFQGGVYLDYAVSGNIVITITSKTGPNAVLSGLFLD